MRSRQLLIHSVTIDGVEYDLKDDQALLELDRRFTGYFGRQAQVWDLLEAFATVSPLTLQSLSISSGEPDLVETRAVFTQRDEKKQGTCIYYWRRLPDGAIERAGDAVLDIDGSRARLSLQIHANMAAFARAVGQVRNFEVEVQYVGRYAFRFLHGVEIDGATRRTVGRLLEEHASIFGTPFDGNAYARLRSPQELSDFIILGRITRSWMTFVEDIIERQGFDFTVDQVVDVARRPGLALLLDQPSYFLTLALTDDAAYQLFLESVQLGRRRRTLRRLRGVIGSPFQQLPHSVRNALIVYRPYLFPRPRQTPAVPDLSGLPRVVSPWRVRGFRTTDDVLLEPVPADPEGAQIRDYRNEEIEQVIRAVEEETELITLTGLSGSGKTELVCWRLENLLTGMGHRVVSLDAMRLMQEKKLRPLLLEVDKVVKPTVTIFDESLYIRGGPRTAFIEYCHRFLKWPGQHIVFVGGGLSSPGHQSRVIEAALKELWKRYRSTRVELMPKPVNYCQAYRFLGLGRVSWLNEEEKMDLLLYVLEQYPPYFIPFMPIRFHEHSNLHTLDEAKELVDANRVPDEWQKMAGMVLEKR